MAIVANKTEAVTRWTYIFKMSESPEVVTQFLDYAEMQWAPLRMFVEGRAMDSYIIITVPEKITPDILPVLPPFQSTGEVIEEDGLRALRLIDLDCYWEANGVRIFD